MVIFVIPEFIFFFIQNVKANQYHKTKENVFLIYGWVLLAIVMLFYYIYLLSNISDFLWQNQIWFTANDILHLGLIIWILFIGKKAKIYIQDKKNTVSQKS
jgi:peptidoglycan biosynthesis protein MviN/MurJ (putative lipid II flippase)